MRTTTHGIAVIELAEIGSTNAEAMRLGLGGAEAPLWVRAGLQVAGRGRSGRAWASEPGNLYASLLVRLDCAPAVIHQLSFVAAVAAVSAIRRVAGRATKFHPHQPPTPNPSPRRVEDSPSARREGESHRVYGDISAASAGRTPSPLGGGGALADARGGATLSGLRLKWPNDILIGNAKLVGILPESTIEGPRSIVVVIGCGINLAQAPDSLGRETTCLRAQGVEVTPPDMLDVLAQEMSNALAVWDLGAGFMAIRARWLADAGPIGAAMTVHTGRDIISGAFAGLGDDGALILRDQTGYDHRMTFGDVTVNAAPDDA